MPLTQVQYEMTNPLSAGFSFRNRIINGDMRIDQRNAGAAQTPTLSSNAYTVDRWFLFSTGATVTTQRVAGSGSFSNAMRITGSASNTACTFAQRIESFNTSDLVGETVSVSVVLSGSASGSVNWSIGFPTSGVDNYTGGTTVISSGTINFTTTPTRYTFTSANLPSGAANGLQLSFEFGALGAAVTRTITGAQLEAGSTPTLFERRPYGLELALCQRYFQNTGSGWTGMEENATSFSMAFQFNVAMRSNPVLSLLPAAVSNVSTRISGSATDRNIVTNSISTSATTDKGAWVLILCSGGNVAGRFIQNRNAADIFTATAEL